MLRKWRGKNSKIPLQRSDLLCTLAEAQAWCFVLSFKASSKAATIFLQNKGFWPTRSTDHTHMQQRGLPTVPQRADAMQPGKPSNMSFISQPNSAPHILVNSPEILNLHSQVTWQCTDPLLMLVKSVIISRLQSHRTNQLFIIEPLILVWV